MVSVGEPLAEGWRCDLDDGPADRRRRARMLRDQLADCEAPAVVAAMATLPRQAFVPAELRANAYDDAALAIGSGQTISQPRVVAAMLAALAPQPGELALDLGCGSGYVAALLARLLNPGGLVVAVERQERLVLGARRVLGACTGPGSGAACVSLLHGDGLVAGAEHAPYDLIHVACAAPELPLALLERLAPGGRMVAPVGPLGAQNLCVWTRRGNTAPTCRELMAVRFVPLLPGTA